MEMFIMPTGCVHAVYGEDVPLHTLGALSITRASTVEPNGRGEWVVDLAPMGGPVLGPFTVRSQALITEYQWLAAQWFVWAESH